LPPAAHRYSAGRDICAVTRGGRFAVVPVMPTKRALERPGAHGAVEQLGIRQDRHAGGQGAGGEAMRPGQVMRNARREHDRIEPFHRRLATFKPFARSRFTRRSVSSHPSPRRPCDQRARGGQPVAAEADDGEALARERCAGGKIHRIFSVPRPTRARIIATIQKRITMVGSDQPFFSNDDATAPQEHPPPGTLEPEHWMITDTVSTTNSRRRSSARSRA